MSAGEVASYIFDLLVVMGAVLLVAVIAGATIGGLGGRS